MKLSMNVAVSLLLSLTDAVLCFAPCAHAGAKLELLRQRQLNLLMGKPAYDQEWLEGDMKKAAKGEHEDDKDWVADEMNELGKAGAPKRKDWIAEEMREAGKDREHHHVKAAKKKKKESKEDKIAKRMKKAGTDTDWIKSDMTETGKPESHLQKKATSGVDRLSRALDAKKEEEYDDVYDDMEKTGKLDSEKNRRIAEDMKKTGERTGFYKLASMFHDITYKLDQWQIKAFDLDTITEDMKEAGQAKDQDWISRDMKVAGEAGVDKARKLPTQKKEINEPKDKNWVTRDMMKLGKADPGRLSSKEKMSKKEMDDLVAEDMTIAGKSSDSWVKHDLEMTGHAQGSKFKPKETTRKKSPLKKVDLVLEEVKQVPEERGEPVPEDIELVLEEGEDQLAAEQVEEPHKKRGFLHTLKHIVMPWRHD